MAGGSACVGKSVSNGYRTLVIVLYELWNFILILVIMEYT